MPVVAETPKCTLNMLIIMCSFVFVNIIEENCTHVQVYNLLSGIMNIITAITKALERESSVYALVVEKMINQLNIISLRFTHKHKRFIYMCTNN